MNPFSPFLKRKKEMFKLVNSKKKDPVHYVELKENRGRVDVIIDGVSERRRLLPRTRDVEILWKAEARRFGVCSSREMESLLVDDLRARPVQ